MMPNSFGLTQSTCLRDVSDMLKNTPYRRHLAPGIYLITDTITRLFEVFDNSIDG